MILNKPPSAAFFDLDKVKRVIGFYEDILRLNGENMKANNISPAGWQKIIVGSLFGWVNADGYRRFSCCVC